MTTRISRTRSARRRGRSWSSRRRRFVLDCRQGQEDDIFVRYLSESAAFSRGDEGRDENQPELHTQTRCIDEPVATKESRFRPSACKPLP